MTDSTSFRVTLRQMADAEDAADRRRLYDMLASQIEVALNNQANSTQVVLWDVQEKTFEKINALHEHQADTNLLLTTVADSLAQIQASVQQVLRATKENSRGIGRLNKRVTGLEQRMDESQVDRADLRRLINELAERVDGAMGAAEARDEARDAESHER